MNSSPKRVLFVHHNLAGGGAERVTVDLLRHLDRTLIRPTLFLVCREGEYLNDVPNDVPVSSGMSPGTRTRYKLLGIISRLLGAVSDADIVVGGMELYPSYLACLGATLTGKPAVGWVHTDLKHHLPIYGAARLHRRLMPLIYPRFRKVVFPSAYARDSFRPFAPLRSDQQEVIHNPSDIVAIQSQSTEPLPCWAKVVFSRPVVLGIGHLNNSIKGFDRLIRSHAELVGKGVAHNLVILGEGRDRAVLEQMAAELGIGDSVFLPGFVPNPYPLIRSACALAVPSRFEAFGIVVVEAMCLGTPVVAADSALGSMEILQRGEYGYIAKADRIESLTSGLEMFLTNPAKRQEYSQRGLRRAAEFSPKALVQQWEALLCGVQQ